MSERFHADYEADLWVLTAWNGAGTALVFQSREAQERMLELYEPTRLSASLPWLHAKQSVNGEHVLAMYEMGFRPWRVSLSPELHILKTHPIPLHHIRMELIIERYMNGKPRTLEVWERDRYFAEMYVQDMFEYLETHNLLDELDFWSEEQKEDAVHKEEVALAPRKRDAPSTPSTVIPGFGAVVSLKDL